MDLPHSSTAIWMQMENDFAAERVELPFLYRWLPFWYGGPKNESHRRKAFKRLKAYLILFGMASRSWFLGQIALLALFWSWAVFSSFITPRAYLFLRLYFTSYPFLGLLPRIVSRMTTNSFGQSVSRYLGEHPVIVSGAMTLAS